MSLLVLSVLAFASPAMLGAWTPGTGSPSAASGFVVNTTNRRDVLAFFNTVYAASEGYASRMAWTGSTASGIAGTTSAAFKDDVRRRINFYRALAGLPGDITFDAVKSGKDQEAALMFSANNSISHTPSSSWTFYTANAAEAAGNSNIALGTFGPGSVEVYMREDAGGNAIAGHRRWLLYSSAAIMGTGDVPQNGTFASANAIWVIGNFKAAPAPKFVPWPNAGFSPVSVLPATWSLSYPNANFGAATVTMTQGGNNIPTTVISRTSTGYGDNTLVWVPTGIPGSVAADTTYNVAVSGISGAGVPASFNYTVTLFDPTVLGESVTITGTGTPPTAGAVYSFNSIAQADSYELKVARGSTATWTEGAEDSPAPQIASGTTGSYPLRQTSLVRTGAKAFQLAFPSFNDQSFAVTRDIMPGSTSTLQFHERGRFATTTTTLAAEISTNGGATWASLWSRNGAGLSSSLWDANWIPHSLSLAAYAGQTVRVRFIMRGNGGSVVVSTSANDGFFLDDITIANATELTNPTVTTLAGNATSFTLNSTTAGAALVAGTSYYMQIRPNVGTRWFGFGPLKVVSAVQFSSEARLAGLAPSAGTLSPAFLSTTTAYTLRVTNSTASMTVTPTVLDPTATVKVQGTTVASGTSSQSIPLAVGTNVINTVVTAQNGIATMTYTLTVTRPVARTVTPVAGANGSISPGTVQTVDNGASLTFTATPASGYVVDGWFRSGLLAQSGGTTYTANAITANTTVQVTFKLRPPDNLLVGTWATRTVLRNLPAVAGSAVDIGSFTFAANTGSLEIALNVDAGTGTWSISKRYVILMSSNLSGISPANTWLKLLPTHDSGAYSGNNCDLDIKVNQGTASLRIRTTTYGSGTPVARIAVKTTGLQSFVNSTASAAVATPTVTVGGNAVDESAGKAGFGVLPSASAAIDVNGGNVRGLRLRPRTAAGPPTGGTWNDGTIILDSNGNLYICTSSGTPGTWKKVGLP